MKNTKIMLTLAMLLMGGMVYEMEGLAPMDIGFSSNTKVICGTSQNPISAANMGFYPCYFHLFVNTGNGCVWQFDPSDITVLGTQNSEAYKNAKANASSNIASFSMLKNDTSTPSRTNPVPNPYTDLTFSPDSDVSGLALEGDAVYFQFNDPSITLNQLKQIKTTSGSYTKTTTNNFGLTKTTTSTLSNGPTGITQLIPLWSSCTQQ